MSFCGKKRKSIRMLLQDLWCVSFHSSGVGAQHSRPRATSARRHQRICTGKGKGKRTCIYAYACLSEHMQFLFVGKWRSFFNERSLARALARKCGIPFDLWTARRNWRSRSVLVWYRRLLKMMRSVFNWRRKQGKIKDIFLISDLAASMAMFAVCILICVCVCGSCDKSWLCKVLKLYLRTHVH